ncbi:WD repeat-containing protein 13-like [Agrilus planipennis]|uniref:WD repeat-containing protein 13-like n=1 Tax=Agrilus planipennis TaxID=224129 RepID=A0A1W4WPA3_AGRPL|nr:WD repeat-containing protein 13-like [Agrilus planipennis]
MTSAFQQQAFALDARYNAHRATNSPTFRTLYIRRRSQLLREEERSPEAWKQYLQTRSQLLQQRYGCPLDVNSNSNIPSNQSRGSISFIEFHAPVLSEKGKLVPTKQAEASRAMVGGNTIAENYAFVGVHYIFDQHTKPVTMVKFANNDRSRLCCSSEDGTLSICSVMSSPPCVLVMLKGHSKGVTCFDWSAGNDLIASSSEDTTIKLWSVVSGTCLRTILDPHNCALLCCLYQPVNNNLLVTGNKSGDVRIANVSTGLFMKNSCRVGGKILSLAFDPYGKNIWVGNDRGEIISAFCDIQGELRRTRRILVSSNCNITSLSHRAWISREARDPMILVNSSDDSLCLYKVIDREGGLFPRRKFHNKHQKYTIKSTFCPIMSFRQGACVVTGSEDGCIYFIDIEKPANRAIFNTLQGHSSPVLSVNFNYDESLLASSDLEGLVIIWKRAQPS